MSFRPNSSEMLIPKWPPAFLNPSSSPTQCLAFTGLGPYPALIAALAVGSSTKHILYILGIAEQEITPAAATIIAVFNTLVHTTNTLLSLWAVTSTAPAMVLAQSSTLTEVILSSPSIMLGLGLYTVGIVTELLSEVQRKAFKDWPENSGKPYGGGLFGWATNINYGGYTLWRAGYACAAAGPVSGMAVAGFFFYDFTTRAIPSLDQYCADKVS